MVRKYPYLSDIDFLNKIYGQHSRAAYACVTILDWSEKPIKEVQGKIISGSISVNGDSAVRRTANLSIKVTKDDGNYLDLNSLFAINKKIYIETGLSNGFAHLDMYRDYPIVWFPFGTFVIQSYSMTNDMTGITINLTLGDKMCLLNGTAGGVIPASTNFESYDTLGPDGDLHTEYIRINKMIPEIVNHFGNEDLNKIIVNDIDNRIKKPMRWTGTDPLYLWQNLASPRNVFYTPMNGTPSGVDRAEWNIKTIIYNYDAGYTYVDFVYPGELAAGAGDTVCTVLDKIKGTLGNYEYFYDVYGNFIFQEIKNYINVSEWRTQFNEAKQDPDGHLDYRYSSRLNTAVYSFDDSRFIISYNNTPNFEMVKNDFVVWGARKGNNDVTYPCRYHLAIDTRPKLVEDWHIPIAICFDTSVDDRIRRCYPVDTSHTTLSELQEKLPQGIVGKYYYISAEDAIYTWITDIGRYNTLFNNMMYAGSAPEVGSDEDSTAQDGVAGYLKMELATYYPKGNFVLPGPDSSQDPYNTQQKTDWRNILYFQGVLDSANGLNNYYWAEMCNEWPKIYNVEESRHDGESNHGLSWYDGVLDMPSSLDWWLDFIDNDSELNKFSVNAIGRRSYAKTDTNCNCVFEPDIPDIIMVNTGVDSDIADSRSGLTQAKLRELGLIPTQVSEPIYDSLLDGGVFNSCYQHVRQILTDYTNYNESISINCLPIYHLEPNTRVRFNNPAAGIKGDYIINSISYTLGNTGTMTINAKKCIEKI